MQELPKWWSSHLTFSSKVMLKMNKEKIYCKYLWLLCGFPFSEVFLLRYKLWNSEVWNFLKMAFHLKVKYKKSWQLVFTTREKSSRSFPDAVPQLAYEQFVCLIADLDCLIVDLLGLTSSNQKFGNLADKLWKKVTTKKYVL